MRNHKIYFIYLSFVLLFTHMKKISYLLSLLVFALRLYGQTSPTLDDEVNRLMNEAGQFAYVDLNAQLSRYDSAERMARAAERWDLVLFSKIIKGGAFVQFYDFEKAEKALVDCKSEINARQKWFSANDSTQGVYRFLLSNFRYFYHQTDDLSKVIELVNESYPLELKYPSEDSLDLEYFLAAWAGTLFEQKQFDQAADLLKDLLFRELNPELRRSATGLLGEVYGALDQPELEREFLTKALENYPKDLPVFEREPFVRISLTLADYYLKAKNTDEAARLISQAKAVPGVLATNYRYVLPKYDAKLYAARGNNAEAERSLREALRQFDKAVEGKSAQRAQLYQQLAESLRAQSDYRAALYWLQRGLVEVTDNFGPGRRQLVNPKPEECRNRPLAVRLLTLKAAVLRDLHRQTGDKRYLGASYRTLEVATETAKITYQQLDRESSRQDWQSYTVKLYEEGVNISIAYYKLTKKPYWQAKAWSYSEKHKAGTLLDALRYSGAVRYAGVPDFLTEKEFDVKQKIAAIRRDIFAEEEKKKGTTDTVVLAQKYNFLRMAYQQQDSISQVLRKDYPEYYRFRYNHPVISYQDAQKGLPDENTAMLEYFLGEESWHCMVLHKGGFQVFSYPYDAAMTNDIDSLRLGVADIEYKKKDIVKAKRLFLEKGHKLYRTLLEQPLSALPPNINRLVLVPDGGLSQVPFELLLTQEASIQSANLDLPYLLRRYAVSYVASATILAEQQKHVSDKNRDLFAGFAPDYANLLAIRSDSTAPVRTFRRDNLRPLPGAVKEVKEIASMLNGRTYLDTSATEFRFKKEASQYRIVHLSMHAVAETDNPLFSGLLFTAGRDTLENNDNDLTAAELYNMHLDNDLVVLSACNTGVGRKRRGEGVLGLSRAFMYAGCPATLMSLWEASDENTASLMIAFYENLRKGMPKDVALQKAKIEFLGSANSTIALQPNQWGAFVACGDMRPIFNPYPWGWILGIGAALLLGGIWVVRRARQTL